MGFIEENKDLKANIYRNSDKYFEKFADRVALRIGNKAFLDQKQNHFKKNIFQVPEVYFESFWLRLQPRLTNAQYTPKVPNYVYLEPLIGFGLGFVFIVAIGIGYKLTPNLNSMPTPTRALLWASLAQELENTQDDDLLYEYAVSYLPHNLKINTVEAQAQVKANNSSSNLNGTHETTQQNSIHANIQTKVVDENAVKAYLLEEIDENLLIDDL